MNNFQQRPPKPTRRSRSAKSKLRRTNWYFEVIAKKWLAPTLDELAMFHEDASLSFSAGIIQCLEDSGEFGEKAILRELERRWQRCDGEQVRTRPHP